MVKLSPPMCRNKVKTVFGNYLSEELSPPTTKFFEFFKATLAYVMVIF